MTNPGTSSPTSQERSGLVRMLRDVLAADPRFQFQSMAACVGVEKNRVYLNGWVPTLADRVRIGEVVASFAGPANVDNALQVGPPNQRPDSDICKSVQDLLEEDRAIDATSIHVSVVDGVVHLTGLVYSWTRRRYIGALCWWVPGVRGVANDLTEMYSSPKDDELLVEVIQEVLEKDPLVDRTEILVLSHDGRITLAGTVGGADAREAAESDAWGVEGVRDVVDEIEVASVPGSGPIFGLDG